MRVSAVLLCGITFSFAFGQQPAAIHDAVVSTQSHRDAEGDEFSEFCPSPVWKDFWSTNDPGSPAEVGNKIRQIGTWLFEEEAGRLTEGYVIEVLAWELMSIGKRCRVETSGRAVVMTSTGMKPKEEFEFTEGVFYSTDIYSEGRPRIIIRGTAQVVDPTKQRPIEMVFGRRIFSYDNGQWVATDASFERTNL